jgi:hypothetical protein
MQGRYFIPLAPAAFILIWLLWHRLPSKFHSSRSNWERNAVCALVAAACSIYALFVIYTRFYVM